VNRKIKFQKGGSVLSSQESLAQQILSGQRPKRRSAAERRGGRTTSNPFTEEQRDTASKIFPDTRVFEKAYDDYTSGKELSSENKRDLAVETGFAALGAVPVFGTVAQRGKPMVKSLLKKLLGEGSERANKVPKPTADKIKGIAPRSDIKTGEVTSVPKGKVDSPKGRGPFDKDGQLKGAAKQSNLDKVAAGTKKIVEKANQKKIAKNLNKKVGGGKPVPAVRKTTSPAVAPKSKVPAVAPKSKVPANRQAGFNLGSPKGKGSNLKKLIGPALATGAGAYLLSSEKDAKPSAGSQAGGTSVNTSSDGSNAGAGAGMDTDLFDTPTGVTGRKPTGTTGRKPKKDPTEGGDYKSYSKDNNDFMYMTQKGYDEEEEQGDKAGGRPGRGKLKTQGMNKTAKRKAGFSGKGSGAALRGF
jgi:hypothetical protein